MKYCNSLANYSRFKTREVKVGNIGIGGSNPIRIQSMTTTDTMDTIATMEESIRMIDAGCELVRITAPSKKEALNLKNIKEELAKRGYNTPIIADIHYTPNAAEIAATIIEKVRVNPGNYADKKKFENIEYTDATYNAEIDRIREKFTPLVRICKEQGTAMRIGTNHGSLSDRILSRYGDTPKGMVESAMEFLRICRDEDYHEIILSMKASNTRVMVQAYRMLVAEMIEEGMNYPLHLGVTEAGEGEDGRIKSAVGIGTLLADGIGDTIRVSLTEAPEFEMPVAQQLLSHFKEVEGHEKIEEITENPLHSFDYVKRETTDVLNIGESNVPVIMADFCLKEKITPASFFALGYNYSVPLDKWHLTDMAADYVFVGNHDVNFEVPGTLGVIYNYKKWKEHKKGYPFLTINDYLDEEDISQKLNIVYICLSDLSEELFIKLKTDTTAVLMIDTYNENGLAEQRKLFTELMNNGIKTPVIIGRAYADLSQEQLQLSAATDMGALLLDGLGDGIFIAAENCGSYQSVNSLAFGILQASRTRISKTEYISCPSCGRTLFDLQETTAKIRKETSHLKGLKIGIMGCIVNGPGEMADADYGYVGTGKGKITLYKEQTVVEKNISEEKAVTALIDLIKEHGDWVERK
ncbi:MAG: (E)-4-hydroxy-3-methylbut-2-enyl-diphosphate synthase [Flavobacteriales bacterium]|jgi:(E)-4-hydroxy-3-methylbut-2-enyl-diphosphate synthase|nr:(E)-4-hydroxy-3-methylbut-2-enyl-diphosphate synthase [Flavobacteriales bacterium]